VTEISYHRFGEVNLKVSSKNVTQGNIFLVDVGDITIKRENREYKLEFAKLSSRVDDMGIIDINLKLGTFADTLEAFQDCKFDLIESDLTHKDLFTTVYIGSDVPNIQLEFISGDIEMCFGTKPQEYIKINCSDEVDQDQFLKLNRIAEQITKKFNGSPVDNVLIDDEFGNVTATVDGVTNVDCGWLEEYFLAEVSII